MIDKYNIFYVSFTELVTPQIAKWKATQFTTNNEAWLNIIPK
jgi:hypothetical protein